MRDRLRGREREKGRGKEGAERERNREGAEREG